MYYGTYMTFLKLNIMYDVPLDAYSKHTSKSK